MRVNDANAFCIWRQHEGEKGLQKSGEITAKERLLQPLGYKTSNGRVVRKSQVVEHLKVDEDRQGNY